MWNVAGLSHFWHFMVLSSVAARTNRSRDALTIQPNSTPQNSDEEWRREGQDSTRLEGFYLWAP